MKKKLLAKRYGVIVMAAALTITGSAPALSAADSKANILAQAAQIEVSKMQILAKDAGDNSRAGEKSDPDKADTNDKADADDKADTNDKADADDKTGTEGIKLTKKTFQRDYKMKNGKVYKQISFEYPEASGDSEAAQTINSLYKKLLRKWKKAAKQNLKDAKEIVGEREDDICYTDEVSYEVMNNDENYISIVSLGYVYELGAHGMPYRYSYIFDTATGKKVSAAKLLGISKKQLNEKVRSLYLEQFDKDPESGFYPSRDDVQSALEDLDFNKNLYYLKDGNIYFYADPYVVGPYAAGFMEVSIDLEEKA